MEDAMSGAALGRLKASQDRTRGQKKPQELTSNAAALSHTKNDDYMNHFHEALLRDLDEIRTASQRGETCDKATVPAARQTGQSGAQKASQPREYTSVYPARVVHGWISGPMNEAGSALDLSDRPLLCSAANWLEEEVVFGGADHALYVLDTKKLNLKRQLYNKSNGHKEWVTCVTYLPNGGILSGGMDSDLHMWTKSGTRSQALKGAGHSGSISKVCADKLHPVAVSASYDKTIRVWGMNGKCRTGMMGHAAPILELETNNSGCVASGDRAGHVRLWDVDQAACTWELRNVHKGHVTSIAFADPSGGNSMWSSCFATGGQDGRFRVWDMRAHSNPGKVKLHVGPQGSGAVSGIVMGGAAAAYVTATCGADKTVRILDARSDIGELACISLPDFPYSFSAAGGLLLAGCGDGSVVVIDIPTLQVQYTLCACENAVRTMQAGTHSDSAADQLIIAGDDGDAISYGYE